MSSAALVGIFLGSFRFGFRMVTLSMLGAGISTLSSSAYISNPVYAIVFGIGSSLFQYIFCIVHDKFKDKIGYIDHNAYVFVGQGFLGIFFEAINRQIVQTNQNNLVFVWDSARRPEYILGNGAITIALGLILGFVIGTLFSCCSYHDDIDHFTDFTYWTFGDGLQ